MLFLSYLCYPRLYLAMPNPTKTLMTVMTELDQTLFKSYVKAKLEVALILLRGGLLDPQMDWYDTPQPTGRSSLSCVRLIANMWSVKLYQLTLLWVSEIRPYMY